MPASQDTLKPLIHLIVVPPGLLSQWTLELHRNLRSRSYRILPYTGVCRVKNRETFFKVLDSDPVETILLVSNLALVSDARTVLKWPTRINKQSEFDILNMGTLVNPALRNNNLFGPKREYGIVVIDEGHGCRTRGPYRMSTATLFARARMAIVMTATPIITSPMVSDPLAIDA